MAIFAWKTTHYPTLQDYLVALLPFRKPTWISGIVLHHTVSPLRSTWRGERTMAAMARYYRDRLGWPSGPHLFLVAGAPNPAHDGIWAGTPLADIGVHATSANRYAIGIEIVGNYDREPWPSAVADLTYGTLTALARWGKMAPSRIIGHREVPGTIKSCPGRMIDMRVVRAEVGRRTKG